MSKFILGDCMDPKTGIPSYPDKYFDLAIVDPPYGIGINMNMGRKAGKRKVHKLKKWDSDIPSDQYFDELFRVSKYQIVWGGNYFPLPLTKSWIFWDKGVPDGVSFADGELAWTSGDKTLKKVSILYSGFQGNDGTSRVHPTQKPIQLYRWLLHNYAKPGDLILDTHVGSASSLIAYEQEGFEYHAWEIDEDYYNASTKRMKQVLSQTRLF